MMPSLFVAHGAPTLVIEDHAYARFLKSLADSLPKPRAIAIASAHWEAREQRVGGAERHDTLHDFRGFPDELYRIRYEAPGDPALAQEIRELLRQGGVAAELDAERGLDHGAWAPLALMYPDADVPVIPLSIDRRLPPAAQCAVGRLLEPLRARGVLLIGSGGTVHNLRRIEWNSAQVSEWAVAFDRWLQARLEAWDLEALADFEKQAPHAADAVPPGANEHFVPLFIALGAAGSARRATLLFRDYQMGSLSLSCWRFG